MVTSVFHPLVPQWFFDTLGAPTPAQARGWASIAQGQHTLIAAPTGSGKTLAAFLIAIDQLVRESLDGPLPDEVRVVYVSPLKALSTDIHKNLEEPRHGIAAIAAAQGGPSPRSSASGSRPRRSRSRTSRRGSWALAGLKPRPTAAPTARS